MDTKELKAFGHEGPMIEDDNENGSFQNNVVFMYEVKKSKKRSKK